MSGVPSAWPVVLQEEEVRLRPLRYRDQREWHRLRAANREWLAPWEATSPEGAAPPRSYPSMVRQLNRSARRGLSLPFAVEVDGELAGQISVAGLVWGSLRGCAIGYWVDQAVAGRGVTPTAVALVSGRGGGRRRRRLGRRTGGRGGSGDGIRGTEGSRPWRQLSRPARTRPGWTPPSSSVDGSTTSTTPACSWSPARITRGSTGRSISGFLVRTDA